MKHPLSLFPRISTILLFLFIITTSVHSSRPFKWGSFKPHLVYSHSEQDLSPIAVRFAFGYTDHSIPIRYDFHEFDHSDLILDYNYHNGRDFSEQTIYDKSKNMQFKTVTIRERLESPLEQWSIYLINPKIKGFVNQMLSDILGKFTTSSKGLFNNKGFMENDSGISMKTSFSSTDEVIFGFSISLEQLIEKIDVDPKDYYLMKADDENNSFLIRNKSNHEIISNFRLKLLEDQITKNIQFDYKFIRNSNKYNNWRIGDDLKDFIKDYPNIIDIQSQENSQYNTVLLLRVPIKLSTDFLLHFLYKEDLTISTSSFEENYELLSQKLQSERVNFVDNFLKKFPIIDNSKYLQCSISSLSNLLGGLSYMYGPIRTSTNPSQYKDSKPLFTMTPCRKGFPRGFLWDEGFHNMIISQFDEKLSLSIITHWLNTVFEDSGWIPREQIRGPEVEKYANRDFLVQNEKEANPPTIILPLNYLFKTFKENNDQNGLKEIETVWKKAKKWFDWFHESQRRDTVIEEYLYHWIVERNGFNLGSGMDDYPRNGNSFISQYHLDLQVWNIVFAELLLPIMEEFETNVEEIDKMKVIIYKSKENLHKMFRDPNDLIYKDTDGTNFSPHLGYDNLFPLMFGLIENDSDELKKVLDMIRDNEKLWSSSGIRSLSIQDQYYRRNDNYWTQPIWININYLVLRGLKFYYYKNEKAKKVYDELRDNIMRTVCDEWKNTGFFWETFDDISNKGTHHNFFNGWTSLITLIISEKYQ